MPGPKKTAIPPETKKVNPWFKWPSILTDGSIKPEKLTKAEEERHIQAVRDFLDSKDPDAVKHLGWEFPVAQNRHTRVPIFDVGDRLQWLTDRPGIDFTWTGSTKPSDQKLEPGEVPIVVMNVKDRASPKYPETLAHEMIHVSQVMNPELHKKAAEAARSSRATSGPYEAVYSKAYGHRDLETEAYIGAGNVYFNKDISKAYSGSGNFVNGKPSNPNLSVWDSLMFTIKNVLSSEPYSEEQFRATRDALTPNYPDWLKSLLRNTVGPTK